MNDVLLTISGVIPADIEDQIARGERPEADYIAMASAFGADLLDYESARRDTGQFGRLLEKIIGANLLLAWSCFKRRHQYKVIFTDGEQVGIPLALLLKLARSNSRPRHLMIVHIISVWKKMVFLDWFKAHEMIDVFFVYSSWQKQFIEARWHISPDRVVFTPFMVDAKFFAPGPADESRFMSSIPGLGKPLICSVGLEFRDYPTLLAAVNGLEVQVIIAAASPWSKRSDSTTGEDVPDNVIVRRFTQYELRDLYAVSQFVVVPLYDVGFQAGVTTILEAMSMEKAVICTRTAGQTDVVTEGDSGLYVPPGDPEALSAAIVSLLENPSEAERMGKNGRNQIIQNMSLAQYINRLNKYVQSNPDSGSVSSTQ